MWLCYKIIPVYGIALILFTILTRCLLIPVSIKQQKSTVRMKLIQPKIQEIQKKYANNREKMQQELEGLYARENYNPMASAQRSLTTGAEKIDQLDVEGLNDAIEKLTKVIEPLSRLFGGK